MLRLLVAFALLGFFVVSTPVDAVAARLIAKVDLSSQTMTVVHRGQVKYRWKVSTARRGKVTPVGTWRAKWLSRHHRSSRYNNAPMPYSIFYNGNYAIHGTNQVKRLGRPASAGCIRLHPSNAAILFRLVQREGLKNMMVMVRR
ncbi:L,D-transpeptidase [Nitratireductor mangrovi]|uniref:L,D-transpeptidase n=1 Tax=Nitratireductor mangrovi TaxID=2599600 RepID=A0A5B8L5Z5_9HYPH|nr:L,D-transpeptidase [Nitratireductor mangrovi]QDZ02898.1 L,D-transpeptidase [Nitratireductor mangrovi]